MRKFDVLPFTASDLARELTTAYLANKDASPWAPVYAEYLRDCWPGVLSTIEWENRLRATARHHHMYQTKELKGVRNSNWASWYAQDFVNRYNQGLPLYDYIHVDVSRQVDGVEGVIGKVRQALLGDNVSDFALAQFGTELTDVDLDKAVQVGERYVDLHAHE
jgi:hypothetical protein